MKTTKMLWVLAAALILCGGMAWSQTAADFIVDLNEAGDGAVIVKYKGSATKVTIPREIDGFPVREIKDGAFAGNTTITAVTVPEGVAVLSDAIWTWNETSWEHTPGVFQGCTKLASVILPATLKKIGEGAFFECYSLKTIELPAGLIDIGGYAFSRSGLIRVVIPAGVTKINGGAFENCTALTSVVIPEGITTIGSTAFRECIALTKVELPEGVKVIEQNAFLGCTALKEVVLPSTINDIWPGTFNGCTSLTSIIIPDTATWFSYGKWTFDGCPLNLPSKAALRKYGRFDENHEAFYGGVGFDVDLINP
jgi:hypothetical protein